MSRKLFRRETLDKSALYGEPASPCDSGINKINAVAPLILPREFLRLSEPISVGRLRRWHPLQGAHWLACQYRYVGVQHAARIPRFTLAIDLKKR